jgi:hypothetical protein
MPDTYEELRRQEVRDQIVNQAMERLRRGRASLGYQKFRAEVESLHPDPELIIDKDDPFGHARALYAAIVGTIIDQIIDHLVAQRDDEPAAYEIAMEGMVTIVQQLGHVVMAFTNKSAHFSDAQYIRRVAKLADELALSAFDPGDWDGLLKYGQ